MFRAVSHAQVLGDPVNVSQDFQKLENVYFIGSRGSTPVEIKVAQSTKDMDWDNVELRVFSTDNATVKGLFTRPGGDVQRLSLVPRGRSFVLAQDPQAGRVKWTINKVN